MEELEQFLMKELKSLLSKYDIPWDLTTSAR